MMFMDLADPRYAYMFGFLQMDGHLSRGAGQKGRLQVEISSRDAEILRAFQELTPYNSTLSERTRTTNFASEHTSTTWNLYSLEARDTLVSLGLPYGRKSRRVTPPRVAFARRDYLRGVIDADGSLGYTGHGFPYLSLTTASTAIATYLCFYGRKVVGAEKLPARNKRDSIYNVLYLKERAVSLVAHLYYPGCLALKRKQQAAQAIQEWVRPPDMAKQEPRRRWRTWEDRFLLTCGDPVEAAAELGRPEKGCRLRLWRLRTGRVPLPPVLAGDGAD